MADRGMESNIYYDGASAADAVEQLHSCGYRSDEISVLSRDHETAQKFADTTGARATAGAAAGAGIGGGLGAIIAGLTATGSIAAIAGTGGVAAPLVAGPLAAALAGLGAGGLAGGIVGALIGAGIPNHKAAEYAEGLDRGGIVIAVRPHDGDRDQVFSILNNGRSQINTVTGTTYDTVETYDAGTPGSLSRTGAESLR